MTITITIGETPVNATYSAVTGTTSGSGTGAKFDVTKTNGVYSTIIESAHLGTGYVVGDTITILGTSLGGVSGTNNEIITVGSIDTGGKIASFGIVGVGRIGNGVNSTTIAVSGTSAVDNYVFTGKSTDFTVVNDTTHNTITAASLLDTSVGFKLSDHERVTFNDKSVAFDITGKAGDVYSILKAAFGGTVNTTFAGAGIKMEDTGSTSVQVAQAFLDKLEFATAAGGTGNDSFVRLVYTNVLGVAPTLDQAKPFVDALNDGTYTQASLLVIAAHLDTFNQTIGLVGVSGSPAILLSTGIEYVPA